MIIVNRSFGIEQYHLPQLQEVRRLCIFIEANSGCEWSIFFLVALWATPRRRPISRWCLAPCGFHAMSCQFICQCFWDPDIFFGCEKEKEGAQLRNTPDLEDIVEDAGEDGLRMSVIHKPYRLWLGLHPNERCNISIDLYIMRLSHWLHLRLS